MGFGTFEHDGRGAEAVGAVDQRHFGREAGEEESLFHGAVATADDGDLLAAGEESVAGGAGADAVADEGLFGGQIEPASGGSGRDDERAGVDDLLADGELDGVRGKVGGSEVCHAEFGSEALRLQLHVLDEFRTLNALGPAGKVFDQRRDGELAAGLVAFEDERLEVRAASVDGGSKTGASGTEDNDVASFRGRGGDIGSHELV